MSSCILASWSWKAFACFFFLENPDPIAVFLSYLEGVVISFLTFRRAQRRQTGGGYRYAPAVAKRVPALGRLSVLAQELAELEQELAVAWLLEQVLPVSGVELVGA